MPDLPQMSTDNMPCLGRLGEYQLLERLGEGAMGTVYKALHTELDRIVAIKVLSRERMGDEQAVARFRREMKAVGRLDHPHIVRAHDAREINGLQFLVMEYVDGVNLGQLSASRGPLPIAEACELIRQAALGLQSAHEHGLIHRDIKPTNLMLSRDGRVKILDLGLARILEPAPNTAALTMAGMTMGTPEFMAPEQVSDSHTVDSRADIYSLGCTLYQLLTGHTPFSGVHYATPFHILWAHVRDPVPPIQEQRPDVPAALAQVVDRMLAKNPQERWTTAAEVAAALALFAAGGPQQSLRTRAEVQAVATHVIPPPLPPPVVVPPTPPERRRSTSHGRHWSLLGGLLLFLAALGACLGWLLPWQLPETDDEPALTERQATASSAGDDVPATQPTAPSGWIVMSWGRQGLGRAHLWLASPSGRRPFPLTRDPRYFEIHPRFSPDARRIAFVRGEPAGNRNGIWVCDVDGSHMRQVVAAREGTERLMEPVWISNQRIVYTVDSRTSRLPEMHVWQVDLDGGEPQRNFSFREAFGHGAGLVTDAAPDGRRLAVLAQRDGLPDTADVFVTDLQGKRKGTVWEDLTDARKDGRALWSPDGRRLAWHHSFATGSANQLVPSGVGLAVQGEDGQWKSTLPAERQSFITPLAWSPDSRWVLCARFAAGPSPATLFLMDDQFQTVRELFDLEANCWKTSQREFGRLADWAVIPPDAPLPAMD